MFRVPEHTDFPGVGLMLAEQVLALLIAKDEPFTPEQAAFHLLGIDRRFATRYEVACALRTLGASGVAYRVGDEWRAAV